MNLKSVDKILAICSQGALDPLMKQFALLNLTNLIRLYFASVDGS